MKFLYFYIISTIICIAVLSIITKSFGNRLKREYPLVLQKVKHKVSLSERISSCFFLLIPVFNIIVALVDIFRQEKIYETILEHIRIKAILKMGLDETTYYTLDELEQHLEKENRSK